MTTAPLSSLLSWAQARGVTSPMEGILDATLAWEREGAIGSVLAVLGMPESAEMFQKFGEEQPWANDLGELCAAIANDRDTLLDKFRPMEHARTAKDRFRGTLERLYLFAFCATGLPPDRETAELISVFRIWIIFHSVSNCRHGTPLEQNTKIIATGLRLAADGDSAWLNLISSLKLCAPLRSLSGFEWLVGRKAEALLAQNVSTARPDSHVRFLKALGKVAKYQIDAIPTASPPRLTRPVTTEEHFQRSTRRLLDYSAEGEVEVFSAGAATFADIEVEPDDSYIHQRLKATTVVLNSVQQNQFLPWHWELPQPCELKPLEAWIRSEIGDSSGQLLKAITWICLNTGRSFNRALEISLSAGVPSLDKDDWVMVDASVLVRRCQRRENSWRPKGEDFQWVEPLAEYEELELPVKHKDALQHLVQNAPNAKTLGELWCKQSSPSQQWLDELRDIAPRLTPGMLGNVLLQRIFLKTNDPLLARIYTRHPQTGLPGSAAYPSWSSQTLQSHLEGVRGGGGSITPTLQSNALGSRLCPVEKRLCDEIHRAQERIRELAKIDLIKFHNAYTAYWTALLLAATGARPVNAVFESWRQFDLVNGFVFINDKASGRGRDGRLVPLPHRVCALLETEYKRYLDGLSCTLQPLGREFAETVRRIAKGETVASMPIFFLLSLVDGTLSWQATSEMGVTATRAFEWTLPLRHFRHRLSQQLRRHDVEPEVVDGWLGHAEQGCATYGDYSFRCFEDDAKRFRRGIDMSFEALPFSHIEWEECFESTSHLINAKYIDNHPRVFGANEREQTRSIRNIQAIRSAKQQIDDQLSGRAMHQLEPEEVEKLRKGFLFNPNGIPKSNGYIQYEYFLRLLEKAERHSGIKVKVKKRILLLRDEPSQFDISSASAIESHRRLATWMKCKPLSPLQPGRGYKSAATWGALYLIIESRLTDWSQLKDVLEGKNYRLVSYHNQSYFEHYQINGDEAPSKARIATRRLPISGVACHYLAHASSSKNQFCAGNAVPEAELLNLISEIAGFDRPEGLTVGSLLKNLSKLVDQANIRELPGIVAGWLSGRVLSYSPNWYDWVRLVDGYPRNFEEEVTSETKDVLDNVAFSAATTPLEEQTTKESLQQTARAFAKELRKTLFQDADIPAKSQWPTRRTELKRLGEQVIRRYAGLISPAIETLGYWICSLLLRKHRGALLKLSTVNRYFSALSEPLIGLAYRIDLSDLEDDELTQLYREVVESVAVRNRHYRLQRLRSFHSWLAIQGKIEDPDWQEVGLYGAHEHVSPGVIPEPDYIKCINQLITERNDEAALLLLLMYRFGLRRSDAQGLTLGNIVHTAGPWIVIVERNKFRQLKTKSSRRIVPSLARFSKEEEAFLENYICKIQAQLGNTPSHPIFPVLCQHRNERASASARIVEVIRAQTGQPHLTGHHARHSAANSAGIAMAGGGIQAWNDFAIGPGNAPVTQEILLGKEGISRRSLPAIQRYLGHALPATTCTSYLHFLGDWAGEFITPSSNVLGIPENVSLLDDVPMFCPISTYTEKQQERHNLLKNLLLYLRLQANGANARRAAAIVGISADIAADIDSLIDNVANRIRLSKSDKAKIPENLVERRKTALWLSRITDGGWWRMLEKARDLPSQRSQQPPTNPIKEKSIGIIGANCQLVLWHKNQVEWIAWALGRLEIQGAHFVSNETDGIQSNLSSAWQNLRCDGQIIAEKFQIDTASTGEFGELRVAQRCALKFKENRDFWLRNSLELALMMCAFIVSSSQSEKLSPAS